jgi:hypothetical protein
MEAIVIKKQHVEDCFFNKGMSSEEIRSQFYTGINKSQWKEAWEEMGLKGKRKGSSSFVIDDGDIEHKESEPETASIPDISPATVTEETDR